jgi:hypothetical protein
MKSHMALGLKTGPRAEKCYFTPANSVLKFNFTPARAKKIISQKQILVLLPKKIQNIRAAQSFLLNLFLGKVFKITTIMPAQAFLLLTLFFKRSQIF